jgi:hypothetical protein
LFVQLAGLPSKHWLGRKCLSQYLARRLETCPQYKHHHLWIISSLHGIILCVQLSSSSLWFCWHLVSLTSLHLFSLLHLILCFQEPNYEDPLNHDAAAVLRDNPKMFESNVRRAMTGGYVGQSFFPRCI